MAEEAKPKKKRNTKPPTTKQLRARAKFVKMVKARAKAAKAAKRAAGIKSKPKKRTVATKTRKAVARRPAAKKTAKRSVTVKVNPAKFRVLDGDLIVARGSTQMRALTQAENRYSGMRKPHFRIERFDQRKREWVLAATVNPTKKRRNAAGTFYGGKFHPYRDGIDRRTGRPSRIPYKPSEVGEKSAYSTKAKAKSRRGQKQELRSMRSLTDGTSLKRRAISNPTIPTPKTWDEYTSVVEERNRLAVKRYGLTPEQKKRFRSLESAIDRVKDLSKLKGKMRMLNPAKRNGIKTAKKQFKEFTGRPSRKVSTNYAPKGSKAPKSVAAMGKLKRVFVKGRAPLNFSSANATLARSGNKMFVLGKGYTLSHVKGRKNPAGFEDLGEITRLEYETTKVHLGDEQPVTYFHKMGEEGGEKPHAVVNDEGLLLIEGGSYTINERGIID